MTEFSENRAKTAQPKLMLSNISDAVPMKFQRTYENYSNEELEAEIKKYKEINSKKSFIRDQLEIQNDEYSKNLRRQAKCLSFLTSDKNAKEIAFKAIAANPYEKRLEIENTRLQSEREISTQNSILVLNNALQISRLLNTEDIAEVRKMKMAIAIQNQNVLDSIRALESNPKFNFAAFVDRQRYYEQIAAQLSEKRFKLNKISKDNQELRIKLQQITEEHNKYNEMQRKHSELLRKKDKIDLIKLKNEKLLAEVTELEQKNTREIRKRESSSSNYYNTLPNAQEQWAPANISESQDISVEELKSERDRLKSVYNKKIEILKQARMKISSALSILHDCYDTTLTSRNELM